MKTDYIQFVKAIAEYDNEGDWDQCRYCGQFRGTGQDGVEHLDGCIVMQARQLLDKKKIEHHIKFGWEYRIKAE